MPPRPPHAMPADVRRRLEETGLRGDYDARPYYQRNDYLGWIETAVRQETRTKRIEQMLDELQTGGIYMGMEHKPSRKT